MIRSLKSGFLASCGVAILGLASHSDSRALVLGTDFAADYTATSFGSVPGLPALYGGLAFLDNNTLLIGGNANTASGRLYTIDVSRGSGGHITGFSGTAQVYGSVGEYNDGGVVFGPGGVLFTSRYPVNQVGQTKPGSTDEDKIINLTALGVEPSTGALNFVPTGFAGAGEMKIVSWSGGQFYTATLAADGTGTYDITAVVQEDLNPALGGIQNVPGGPEGFVYIDGANAGFGADSMLISEYSAGNVGVYELDSNGNPLVATRRIFLSGLSGAEGAAIDPITGDFLFSTFGGGNQVVSVRGFLSPPPSCGGVGQPPCAIPEPGTLPLSVLVLLGMGVAWVRNRK